MKKKILIVFLIYLFLGEQLAAKKLINDFSSSVFNNEMALQSKVLDTVKKKNITAKSVGIKAIIPPPLTTPGSACKDASQATVQVFLNASGGSGDVIEWYASQTSSAILHTGGIYAPLVGSTTTYYVRTRSGADFSIRVPVVASVYVNPPAVTLSMSPNASPICQGTKIDFTATGGGNYYEFSVDGIVKQAMSTSNTFSTSDLTNGQTVKVRSRYGVVYDGLITDAAWGTGALEDNFMSAALSPNAIDGYVNSIKISATEDELVFGISGKLGGDKSMLLFLDTKPGGFNIANYGDEPITPQLVKGFNYFNNNNPYNIFDSYFFPDYCIAIQSNDGGATYFADVIELKLGTSTKVTLTGLPNSLFGFNSGNTGINDYNLGFEVGVLKTLVGYTVGDIKFFALTMQDDIVTNSFLSPETLKTGDYGVGFVDYNNESPNPVVVSGDALKPCYKESSLQMNFVDKPTTATVGPNQNNCTLISSSLGGNTPTVGSGKWTFKSGPGAVIFSNDTSGSSSASVSIEGQYVFTWTISNSVCPSSFADIIVDFNNPLPTPTVSSVTQPSCGDANGSFTITNYNSSYTYTATPSTSVTITGNTISAPMGSYTIKAVKGICSSSSSTSSTINSPPVTPDQPLTGNVTQPTCTVATGSFTISNYNSGYTYSASPSAGVTFSGSTVTAPAGSYTITATLGVCSSIPSSSKVVNVQPVTPPQPTISSLVQPSCTVSTGSFTISNHSNTYTYTVVPTAGVTMSGSSVTAPSGTYTVTATLGACFSSTTVIINTQPVTPDQPLTGSVTQPTCTVATGSFTISNYNSGYAYSASPSAGVTFSGSTVTAPAGSYTITATLGVCSSIPSSSKVVNVQPVTPPQPTISSLVQPSCTVSTGSFTISNHSNTYTYTVVPTAGVTMSGSSITAPSGTYTVTATLGACFSSTTVIINTQPVTPVQPLTGSVTQPTCTVATGSFTISNYNSGYTYSASPSAGVTFSGSTVTAPAGSYTITATLGVCSSIPSSSKVVNVQPVTPPQPTISSLVQPSCTVSTGSFTISNHSNTYTYTVVPTAGVTMSGSSVTAPSGTYTVTATIGACFSSTTVIINTQPVTPVQPLTGSVTQPTCTVATGSFTISNYNSGYAYSASPSAGVTFSGSTVTAPAGSYTITATLGVCSSIPSSSKVVNVQPVTPPQPTISSLVQPSCTVSTGSFTISNHSNTYTYTVVPTAGVTMSGSSVTAPSGTYTVTATLGACFSSTTVIINTQPVTPDQPLTGSVTQPTCTVATGSFTISNYNSGYTYSASPSAGVTFTGSTVTAPAGSYTITATLGACSSIPSSSKVVNVQPVTPPQPTISSLVQPSCISSSGSFKISNYSASYSYTISPSTGVVRSVDMVTAPAGTYTVTATLGTCTSSASITVNPIPPQIQFETKGNCVDKDYVVTASPLNNSYDTNTVDYEWRDNLNNIVGTNSDELNVTNVVNSMVGIVSYPLTFTLKVSSSTTQCATTNNVVIESVFCNIQKGISPDGNGSNDFLDLKVMDVKYLQIFDRYGIRVFDQHNYKDQWKGQSNKGEELPSATYYYVIDFNTGKSKTGWIYLIR
ncbi:gliding motility-associated C-terminal domain-containing protein [Flavobacterium ovatum]|uniref:T9SS type B sorting domain-containing protein n=1 Tax=Flavobacterium ovatum TaxID=1928857 RepID=UPI00344D91A6